MRFQCLAQRHQACAKGGKLVVAIGDKSLERLADALLTAFPKIVAVPFRKVLQNIQGDERKYRTHQAVGKARIMTGQATRGRAAKEGGRARKECSR